MTEQTGPTCWPLFGLRLATPQLLLRPCTEADVTELSEALPADVEQDPSIPALTTGDGVSERGRRLLQFYWRCMGNWAHEHWRLNFVVLASGRLIGMQELEANDFAARGVVETSSWLVPEMRGRGIGREMRAAVLRLAFDGLGAAAAETEAWHDNLASLGVSRSLGYEPNGETLHPRGDGQDRMVRLRLSRAKWLDVAADYPTEVSGLDACRHLLLAAQ